MLRKPGRICSTTWTLGCRDEGNAGNFWMLLAWAELKFSTLESLLLIHSCRRKSQIPSSSISTAFQSLLRKMVEKEMKAAKAWFTAHFLIRKTKCDSFSIVFQCLSWHSTCFFWRRKATTRRAKSSIASVQRRQSCSTGSLVPWV